MSRRHQDHDVTAATSVIERVERETAGLFGAIQRRRASEGAPGDDGRGGTVSDGIEVWGRRVGRALGLLAAALLAVNLFTHWFF
ncbi:MAG: hypothetical protein JO273_19625 [Methylobacteriaceae bacterium]|nr:hypothetical protein [Methylobacteriaceae bacterium]